VADVDPQALLDRMRVIGGLNVSDIEALAAALIEAREALTTLQRERDGTVLYWGRRCESLVAERDVARQEAERLRAAIVDLRDAIGDEPLAEYLAPLWAALSPKEPTDAD
jgi:hypothetical protein